MELCNSVIILFLVVSVQFEMDEYSAFEAENSVEVCVTLTGSLLRPVDVEILTESDTATANIDFIGVTETVQLLPALSRRCVVVTIIEDDLVENMEGFRVSAQSGDAAVNIPSPTVTVSIADSSRISFSFNMESYMTLESESVLVCVLMDGGTDRSVVLSLLTANTGKIV